MSRISRVVAHALVFAAAFTFEVRVRASEHAAAPAAEHATKEEHALKPEHHADEETLTSDVESSPVQIGQAEAPLQEPELCVKSDRVCAVRTESNEKFEWVSGDVTLTLDRSSAILRETPTLARLIDGTLWVRTKSKFTVRTEFGDVKLQGPGEMWVSREGDRIVVSASANDVIMSPRGAKEDVLVETGNQNWLSKVAFKTGEAESGLPTAIPLREHIERWARLYPGKVQEFRIAVRSFHGRWSSAAEKAATLHKVEFERKVASLEQQKALQVEAARKREVEDRKLRDLFRKKVLEGL